MENLATIKLDSGEELLAIVEEGPGPLEITVYNPVVVHKQNSALGPVLSVSHWLMFTKQNAAVIKKSKIVALKYDIEDNTVKHYKKFTEDKASIINLDDHGRVEEMITRALNKMSDELPETLEELDNLDANTTIH